MNLIKNLIVLLRTPERSSSSIDLEPNPIEENLQNNVLDMPQWIAEISSIPKEAGKEFIELPQFSNIQYPDPQHVRNERILSLPQLSSVLLSKPLENEREQVVMPHFYHLIPPQEQNREGLPQLVLPQLSSVLISELQENKREQVAIPHFYPFGLPQEHNQEGLLQLTMPPLSLFSEPISQAVENEFIDLPSFAAFRPPHLHPVLQERSVQLPEFSLFQQPVSPVIENLSLEIPHFSSFQKPYPKMEDPLEVCVLPEFTSFSSPIAKELPSSIIQTPPLSLVYHPVIENFDKLSRTKSYQHICLLALQQGTWGDVKMLKHPPHQLHIRFLNNVFNALMEEASSLLPQSPSFKMLLENDQLQLNLLATFCKDLVGVNNFEELENLLALGIQEHGSIPFIQYLTEHRFESDLTQQMRLLKLKESLYCFIGEILKQERENGSKFGSPQKELTFLEENLILLATHIQSQIHASRMREIHAAENLDFSIWEDRKVVLPADNHMDLPDLDGVALKNVSQVLAKGLLAIQKDKPKFSELKDFTYAVLSLDISDFNHICRKAKYLLELGKVYSKLPGMPALHRALSWIDLAISTIQGHPTANLTNRLLLECYEYRGIIKLKKAVELKKVNPGEDTLLRQQIDDGSRDFQHSYPLEKGTDDNFVRKLHQGKSTPHLDAALVTLEKAIQGDEDYAEARYHQFLKEFQHLQLDSLKMLHSDFECLARVSKDHLMQHFKEILCRSSHLPERVVMKIKLASGTLFIKCNAQEILINREEKEVLTEILTKGIKKASVHDVQKRKIYFCQRITKEDLLKFFATYQKRWRQIEKGIQTFHAFEIRALYKMSLNKEGEKLDCEMIRKQLKESLLPTLLDLDKIVIEGYCHLGRRSKDGKSKKIYAKALSHLCRAIANCDRLLAYSTDQELKSRKLDLMTKRAFVYKQMGLWKCHCSELEEILVLGKRDNPRFCQPSLHYALGIVYRRFNRTKEAKEQFYLVQGSSKGRDKSLSKKVTKQLEDMTKASKINKKNSAPPLQSEDKILANFQDQNIREECLQIIHDHYRANGKIHLHRNVPYWETFVASISSTTTIKQFCEVVLSSVLQSEKVSGQNLLCIAHLSNVTLEDPKTLDEIKKYLQDALTAYQEETKRIEDQAIEELEKTKAEHVREQNFVNFRENLKIKLKEGELLRPGSKKREALSTLAVHLRGTTMDSPAIIKSVSEIIGPEEISDTLVFTEERIAEVVDILEEALDKKITPFEIKKHVLQIFGNHIFLSEIKEKIKEALVRDSTINDVHIMGLHVYVDTSIKFPGTNLALGGEYVQFMLYKGSSGRDEEQKLTIDLSGNPGAAGAELDLPSAANGVGLSEKGADGKAGNDGNGGKPGGDFCVSATKVLVGNQKEIIEKINLSGGEGGQGSRGQEGGKGRDGVQGEDGRDGVCKGDLADSSWGYIDRRDGKPGYRAGDGGDGGTGGRGGQGGETGRLILDNYPNAFKGWVEEKDGDSGKDGEPGQGGKAGKAERDGLDRLYVKGGLFSSREEMWGIKLECTNSRKDRKKESWRSTLTIEKSIERNQGKSKGRGKTAEEASKRRKEEKKNDLKREMFRKGLSHHIHTKSAENKASAFDEVTNRLAVVAETEAVMITQLNALQKRIGDIETLHQTTATLLQQTQAQQNTQVQHQHARLATFTHMDQASHLKKEIHVFFNNPFRDKENLLPFLSCSPVVHDRHFPHSMEWAIHTVNKTRGQNCAALAQLIDKIAYLSEKDLHDKDKRATLVHRLTEIINKMPLRYGVDGFSELVDTSHVLMDADSLKQMIHHKNEQIKEFKKEVEQEKKFINNHYEFEVQDLTMKVGILKFLYRMLFLLDKHAKAEKRKQWFDQALYQRIIRCAHQVMEKDPPSEVIDIYFHYTQEMIQSIKENPSLSGKESRRKIVSEHKALQKNVKKFRFHQSWILEHLTELCEAKISPQYLWKRRKEGENLDDFYLTCSKHWTNIFSAQTNVEDYDESSATLQSEEEVTDTMKWIQSIKQKDWDAQKIIRLEKQVKELKKLKGKLGNLVDYLEQLQQIYLDPLAQEELAEGYLTLLQTDRNPQESLQFIRKIHALKESTAIDQLRKKFPYYFNNTNFTDSRERKLADLIHLYLQKKHIELIKNRCVAQLSKEFFLLPPQREELERLIQSLFMKVNAFYAVQIFLPEKDFFTIAEELIHEQKAEIFAIVEDLIKEQQAEIISTKSPQPHPTVLESDEENNQRSPDFIARILLRIVAGKIELNHLDDHDQLLALLQRASVEGNFDTLRALFFVLINRDLSYSENLKVVKILSNKQINKSLTQQQSMLKIALAYFNQKIASQQAKFKMQWQAVLEKGKQYDHRRQLVDQEDKNSIEKLLVHIAEDADWLDPDQKIEILEKMIMIITGRGCVTSISTLQSLKNQLIIEQGSFPILSTTCSEAIREYNQALRNVFNSTDLHGIEALPPLLMKTINQIEDKSFLLPALLAIEHLPLEADQLILLMKKIGQLSLED